MNVFIDNHHAELTYSLELLFGRRLGHKIFYPIGLDWHERGFWKVYQHPATVKQYLSMERVDPLAHLCPQVMTASGPEAPEARFHYYWDPVKEVYQRAITFDDLAKNPPDILVASIPEHVACFRRLIKSCCPRAKLVFQMGNMFSEYDLNGAGNILNSTNRSLPFYKRSVSYSQEFDLNLFCYSPPSSNKLIVNLAHYTSSAALYGAAKSLLEDFRFEAYGAGNETGSISRTVDVAAKMKEASFIWHIKEGGDGYGHVVHNAAALGRPLIISKRQYRGMRFEKFIEDGKTCINVDGLSAEQLARKIRTCSEPERLKKMGHAIYERFRECVDFDRDEKNIRRFLSRLR